MGREAHRYTLEEYKEMVRERNDLMALEDILWELQGTTGVSSWRPTCNEDLEDYKRLLKKLEDPYSKWQGADADAYSARAWNICHELKHAMEDYDAALKNIETKIRARIDDLIWCIADCEENFNMTLGGNIVVQAGNALGIEVK